MLAKQEQIRMALEEIQQNLENPEDQLKLKEAIEKMKQMKKILQIKIFLKKLY